MENAELICIFESFLEESPELPDWLNNYNFMESRASRRFSVGRASGGILIHYKKGILKCGEIVHTNFL